MQSMVLPGEFIKNKGRPDMTRDLNRGKRIRKAISTSKIVKAYALAAEINVSIAAVSKWQNGGEISLNNA